MSIEKTKQRGIKKMKKIIMSIMAAVTLLFTGCEWDEPAITGAANSAGSIAMLTWFSIDNPDEAVKTVLKDVVNTVTSASVDVAAGKTYLDSVLPQVQELALKQEKLNDYQKQLILAGSVVILNGLDTFLATNAKAKENAETISKVVAAFGKGCQTVLALGGDCPECQYVDKAFKARSIKCRGGKFVTDAPVEAKAVDNKKVEPTK